MPSGRQTALYVTVHATAMLAGYLYLSRIIGGCFDARYPLRYPVSRAGDLTDTCSLLPLSLCSKRQTRSRQSRVFPAAGRPSSRPFGASFESDRDNTPRGRFLRFSFFVSILLAF